MRKFFLLLFLLPFFFPLHVFAKADFSTSYDISYAVTDMGVAHAQFTGTLVNTTDTKFVSSYALQTGFSDIENVQASDQFGAVATTTEKSQNGEIIHVKFTHFLVGNGEKRNFTITFDTNDIAKHVGSIWEVNIPGIANQEDFQKFSVHLRVPPSFGKISYVKPVIAGTSLDFDKATLGSAGISLAFGTEQSYSFTLDYHLQNTNFFPTTTEIALPPSTNYQTVEITDISPRPANVVEDTDGNWLAQYSLLPSSRETVRVQGKATVSLTPSSKTLTTEERKVYTSAQSYWEKDNTEIKQLAQDLKTPDAIYQYVVTHLSYDFSRIAGEQTRVGAAAVLKNPTSAVCLEFTDLFIALARAAGIPAREVDGYAFTQNQKQRPLSLVKDILHAWPEYYDDSTKQWIMVDPTWENTTKGIDYFHVLDFDHLAFVIKGVSSVSPIPAGGYKFTDTPTTKDIFVNFGDPVVQQDPKAGVGLTISPTFFSGFPIQATLFVRNAGGQEIPPQEVKVTSKELSPHIQMLQTADIPPFGFIQQTIGFNNTSFLTNQTQTITIELAGNTITKSVHVYPLFFQKEYIIGGICFVILCLIIFVIAARSRRVSISK